jgi:hypothetical protein
MYVHGCQDIINEGEGRGKEGGMEGGREKGEKRREKRRGRERRGGEGEKRRGRERRGGREEESVPQKQSQILDSSLNLPISILVRASSSAMRISIFRRFFCSSTFARLLVSSSLFVSLRISWYLLVSWSLCAHLSSNFRC